MSESEQSFFFGGQKFPIKSMNKHQLYLGATGAGKSVSIQILLQSVLPEIGKHADEGGCRALIYDAKLDVLPMLWEMEELISCPIQLTNPFDCRASSWAIAKDITSISAAMEMANIICPINESAAQPFFDRAVVSVLGAAFIAQHLIAPNKWDLRTTCLALRSEHHLRELLMQTSETRHVVDRYMQEKKLMLSIMATIDSKMQPYSVIAALWDKAESSFSLRDFRDGESILVLGSNEEAKESVRAINRVLIKRLSQLLLAQPDSRTRRTIICLDEVREAGNLDISSLALRGRSKGTGLIIGAQDIDGMVAVYGQEIAHELLGQFGYKAVLKLDSPTTAKWASSLFASTEVMENSHQVSRSFNGSEISVTVGANQTLREREVVLTNQILYLPDTSVKGGLYGYYKTPYGSYKAHFDFLKLLHRRSDGARMPSKYNFQERPETDQYLADWTAEELQRFGLTPIPREGRNSSSSEERPRRPRNRGRQRNVEPNNIEPNEENPDDSEEDII